MTPQAKQRSEQMTALIGTSGFQYPEWKGKFYPEKMPAAKMLPFYAEYFSTTEINYSFRRIPSVKTIESWSKSTPEHFRFSLKAPQRVTHFSKLRNCGEIMDVFWRAVSGLGQKLGPILFQLPSSFKKDAAILGEFLGILPEGMRVAFEFRHASWFDDEIYAHLHKRNATLCLAESSELITPLVVTSDFGHLRLRKEDYEEADLVRWALAIQSQRNHWKEAFIYFKHEATGTGPRFGARMIKLLET
jgi:uncharacterized protein YecE (DUF72 family)